MHETKSGTEIVEDFFKDLPTIKGLDKSVVDILIKLFSENKLSPTILYNELDTLRKRMLSDKT